MVKIRLRRTGAKKQPHYRVVVTDSRSPRDGKFIENIGHYNPRTEPPTVEIDAERALYWLSVGAQPSDAVKRMLDKMGIMAQVPAVRKGEKSLDEILAEIELTKAAKAALKEEPAEEEAVEEETPEAEAEPAEAEEEAPEEELEDFDDAEEEAPEEELEDSDDAEEEAPEEEFEDSDDAEEAEPAEEAEDIEEEEAEASDEEDADTEPGEEEEAADPEGNDAEDVAEDQPAEDEE
jgi:small subunit ribosomal protein S16